MREEKKEKLLLRGDVFICLAPFLEKKLPLFLDRIALKHSPPFPVRKHSVTILKAFPLNAVNRCSSRIMECKRTLADWDHR
jgi:hypothetical protein